MTGSLSLRPMGWFSRSLKELCRGSKRLLLPDLCSTKVERALWVKTRSALDVEAQTSSGSTAIIPVIAPSARARRRADRAVRGRCTGPGADHPRYPCGGHRQLRAERELQKGMGSGAGLLLARRWRECQTPSVGFDHANRLGSNTSSMGQAPE